MPEPWSKLFREAVESPSLETVHRGPGQAAMDALALAGVWP